MPVVLYALYFLALQLTQGIDWTIHLWLGSIFMAGLIGLFVSFLTVVPLSTTETPQELPELEPFDQTEIYENPILKPDPGS